MGFSVDILADSQPVNCGPECRLTTIEMKYPRIVHAEHLRHRMFSFNVASSRAIPVKRMIADVWRDPFVPEWWGAAQKGMQADSEVGRVKKWFMRQLWLKSRLVALVVAWLMVKCGLHKQIPNRLLEPWMWVTVICTGNKSAWDWFFGLRCHPAAEPHIRHIAEMCRDDMHANEWLKLVKPLKAGEWHLPLVRKSSEDALLTEYSGPRVSAGRCARVSYLTHDGKRDVAKDLELSESLTANNHWSPTEHQAQVYDFNNDLSHGVYEPKIGGNIGYPWIQFRKTFKGEYIEVKKN